MEINHREEAGTAAVRDGVVNDTPSARTVSSAALKSERHEARGSPQKPARHARGPGQPLSVDGALGVLPGLGRAQVIALGVIDAEARQFLEHLGALHELGDGLHAQ